jgi:hypothetical protein
MTTYGVTHESLLAWPTRPEGRPPGPEARSLRSFRVESGAMPRPLRRDSYALARWQGGRIDV